jgi:hypothetical protein
MGVAVVDDDSQAASVVLTWWSFRCAYCRLTKTIFMYSYSYEHARIVSGVGTLPRSESRKSVLVAD